MAGAYTELPAGLPVPVDDGGANHVLGVALPDVRLPSTSGGCVTLSELGAPRAVLYLYPMTGRPGVALPVGWDEIPGARGCTPEACGFRDHHAELADLGAAVYGLSSQDSAHQLEAVQRLGLPFPLLSDPDLALAHAARFPTFDVGSQRLYRRLTLIVDNGQVARVFYPVFPPDGHASQVIAALRDMPGPSS